MNHKFRFGHVLIILSTILSIGIYSCRSFRENTEKIPNGYWKAAGYGQLLKAEDRRVYLYDIYQGGCALNAKAPKSYLAKYLFKERLNDTLIFSPENTAYRFIKAGTDTFHCSTKQNKNPLVNFDALWNTFNENYPSFNLRSVNWNELRSKYRNKLSNHSTDLELYIVLRDLISELNDGHVSILLPKSLKKPILSKVDEDNDSVLNFIRKKITTNYLSKIETYNNGVVVSGLINDSVAYIQVNDFETFANYAIDSSVHDFNKQYEKAAEKSDDYRKDVIEGASKVFNSLFSKIQKTKTCIIDLRFNGGGSDEVGLVLASHLISEKQIAYYKKAKVKNGFTPNQAIPLTPSSNHFAGKVYLLTSHKTASAAEVFLLTLLKSKAIRIGSSTEGIFSDILDKRLPNGWSYGLSNEVYTDLDKRSYEKIGIPPHLKIEYPDNTKLFYQSLLNDLKTGDQAIEKALELIQLKQ